MESQCCNFSGIDMQIDKMTSKLQSALADAQSLALGKDHNFIEAAHLMLVLLQQKGGSVRPLLSQTGFNVGELLKGLQALVDQLPNCKTAMARLVFPVICINC